VNVTIFSDASLCPETRVGGWAGWIKSDRGVLAIDGEFRDLLIDTTIAEAMAAINSICYAISRNQIEPGDTLVLATDNNSVMNVLEGRSKRKFRWKDARRRGWTMKEHRIYINKSNSQLNQIASIYKTKVIDAGIALRWNHVKGHRGNIDKRSAVNHGCDRRAKTAMRNARKRSKKEAASEG